MTNELAKLDKATQMLAEAKTLDDIRKITSIADAAKAYAKAAKLGLEAYNHAAEVKVRAERKAGEMLKRLERGSGPGRGKTNSNVENVLSEYTAVLTEHDIAPVTAHRWQLLADMPEKTFEATVEELRGERPVSTSAVIQAVRREEVREKLDDIGARTAKKIAGIYDVIVIDPPWPMEKIEREVAPNQVSFDYPTMTVDEIAQMKIPAAEDCHVFLWTTQKFLPSAFGILAGWDVRYVCAFTWHKPGGFQPFGLPQYNSEFCLYGRVGTPRFVDTKDFDTCFNAPRAGHSEKPDLFYATLRRVAGGRRLDMFNRRFIDGFDGWGNQAHE